MCFARFLTRPPDNLGMPLTLTPQSRIRFAPMRMWPCYGTPNIAYAGRKASERWGSLSGAAAEELPRARVERSSCSSVGGGSDLDGVGGIRTVDSQPVASGQSEASWALGSVPKKKALVRYERFFLRTQRSLLHSQPWSQRPNRDRVHFHSVLHESASWRASPKLNGRRSSRSPLRVRPALSHGWDKRPAQTTTWACGQSFL